MRTFLMRNIFSPKNKTIKRRYKKKYLYEKESMDLKLREHKKLRISELNSHTAKNGYKEEDLVCHDLNHNPELQNRINQIIGNSFDTCSRLPGSNKTDILSANTTLSAQVKKFKHGQFQQLDRHWVDNLIEFIPELDSIKRLLKNMCEYPLLPNGTHVDKSASITKLCPKNYSSQILDSFTNTLNDHKRKILEYAFYGSDRQFSPDYLIGIEYVNKKRSKLSFFKIDTIINYLETQTFTIKKSKTVIALGDHNTITLQRKGGDSGKRSSNQLQFKIIISSLKGHEEFIYTL